MAEDQETKKLDCGTLFERWQKYEDVAMHFNGLLMELRTKALGTLAAIGAVVGAILIRSETAAPERWAFLGWLAFFLLLLWTALWHLDRNYYGKLLSGAVEALLEIEHKTKGEITLSTHIDDRVRGKKNDQGKRPHPWRNTHREFYWFVFLSLAFFAIASFWLSRR